jgi:hypothetical protein
MTYEIFDSKAVRFGCPQLTIRSGKIAFNADAGDVLSQAGARFAHLLWDEEACKLAIQPTGKADNRAFRISFAHGKRGGSVTAASFLKYINWSATGPVVVSAAWNEDEQILEASIPRIHVGARASTQQPQRRTKKSL